MKSGPFLSICSAHFWGSYVRSLCMSYVDTCALWDAHQCWLLEFVRVRMLDVGSCVSWLVIPFPFRFLHVALTWEDIQWSPEIVCVVIKSNFFENYFWRYMQSMIFLSFWPNSRLAAQLSSTFYPKNMCLKSHSCFVSHVKAVVSNLALWMGLICYL